MNKEELKTLETVCAEEAPRTRDTLPDLMRRWGMLSAELAMIEAVIKAEVLELQQSQTVGNVRASYSQGRGSYNYEALARTQHLDPLLIASFAKEVIDWKGVVDCLQVDEEIRRQYYTPGVPTVSIKLRDS